MSEGRAKQVKETAEQRKQRQASELRANLARRKALARALAKGPDDAAPDAPALDGTDDPSRA